MNLTTEQIKAALRRRYCAPEYALLFEVPNSTGSASSWCDAVAMGLWRSRGHALIGFEIKASRSDWLRERKRPEKAEGVAAYCDEWYLVAGGPDIVKPDELPPTWGLILPRGGGLTVALAPRVKLEPRLVSRAFLAAIFRKSVQQSVDETLMREAREEGRKQGRAEVERSLADETREHERLREKLASFQRESGVDILHPWRGGADMGRIVKQVLDGEYANPTARMRRIRDMAAGLVADLDRELRPEAVGT